MSNRVIWENEEGVFLRVLVKPNSKSNDFVAAYSKQEIVLNLSSPARDGKANKELIKQLSKLVGIPSIDVTIVSGHKGREKIIFIPGMAIKDLEAVFNQASKR